MPVCFLWQSRRSRTQIAHRGRDGVRLGPGNGLQVAGILVAVFVLYTLSQLAIERFVSTINPWLGAVIAVAPVFLLFALGPAGQISALMFIGVSLVATAVRADGGCEVMTLSGMPMGRRTHLVCLVFSPMDWVEDRLSGGLPRAEDKAA